MTKPEFRMEYIKAIYDMLETPEFFRTFINSMRFSEAKGLYLALKKRLKTLTP